MPRWPAGLTVAALLIFYGWMLSWSHGFLYTYYTDHFKDNFRALIAFYTMLTTIRLPVLRANLRDMALACALFASALTLGRIALDSAFKSDLKDDWGRNLKALGLGLGLFSLSLLLLGLAGLWTTRVMSLLILLPLAAGTILYGRAIPAGLRARDVPRKFPEFTPWEGLGFLLLASYLALNFMSALGPEYFYDSLVYHLAMPKLYLLHQRIVPTPNMLYSGIPLGTEMLYGLGLSLGTETAAKLIHFGFGVATAAAVYLWCRKYVNRKAGLFAALLFYSAPMVCFAGSVAKVELAMTFYLLLAAFLVLEAVDQEDVSLNAKSVLLAGVFAGLAFGTKYNAGLYIPVLALPLLYKQIQAERFDAKLFFKQAALFFGAAALVSSPWLIKNWLFFHNPTYPFLNDFFGTASSADVAGLRADAHARNIAGIFTTWSGFKNLFLDVWNPHGQNMDSYAGPALEIGLPWLFLVRWKATKHRGLLIVLAGLWTVWALHTTLSRFLLPAVPIFSILVASALCLIQLPRPLRALVLAAFYYTVTISMARTFLMLARPGAWKVAYGRAAKSDYLLHEHPAYTAPYYSGVQFINENLAPDATVLFIGEERGYYCERKFITASMLDVNPMQELAATAPDTETLLAKLKQKGVTHLLINTGSEHYQRWLSGLGRENLGKYEALLNAKAELLFNHKQDTPNDRSWVQVYRL